MAPVWLLESSGPTAAGERAPGPRALIDEYIHQIDQEIVDCDLP